MRQAPVNKTWYYINALAYHTTFKGGAPCTPTRRRLLQLNNSIGARTPTQKAWHSARPLKGRNRRTSGGAADAIPGLTRLGLEPGRLHRPRAPTAPQCAGSCGSPGPRCPVANHSEPLQEPAPTGRPQAGSSPPPLFATAPGPSPTVPARPLERLAPRPRWTGPQPQRSRTSGGPTPPPSGR